MIVREAYQKFNAGIKFPYHGYIRFEDIHRVNWEKYHQQFPSKYFGIPDAFADVIAQYQGKETLEVGGNKVVAAKYAYDLYVKAINAENLSWDAVKGKRFDLTFLRNAINYLTAMELKVLIKNSDAFIANTFLVPPDKKVTGQEAAVRVEDKIYHALRTPLDNIMTHSFFAYDRAFYESLGLTVLPYGRNSALVVKGLDTEAIRMSLTSDIKNHEVGSLTSWGK